MAKKKKETRNTIRSFLKYRFLISYLHITELLQRRDLYDIFAEARQGPFCPFTFPFFSRETTFLASAFEGLRESHPLSLHPRARFFLKRGKKEEKPYLEMETLVSARKLKPPKETPAETDP